MSENDKLAVEVLHWKNLFYGMGGHTTSGDCEACKRIAAKQEAK